jgi:phage tail tape-measure protein
MSTHMMTWLISMAAIGGAVGSIAPALFGGSSFIDAWSVVGALIGAVLGGWLGGVVGKHAT